MIRLAACLAVLTTPVLAQDASLAAEAARQRLSEARGHLDEARDARDRVAALTEAVQSYEDGLTAMRDGLRRVALREETLTRQLDAKSDEIARLLGVLQTMGRAPAPLLLLHPSGPLGTARGGMILSDVTPALQAQADALRAQLDEVARLRAVQDGAAEVLADGLKGASDARTALTKAISERTDLPRRFADDPVQTALMLASTETLDDLAGLLATVEGDGALPPAEDLRGALPLPVAGRLLRGFRAADASGTVRPGILLATQPRALVATPTAATLRFKGPLLDYGTVAIIEPAADTLIVLAGLAEVFGSVGEILPEGSPLGLMGGAPPQADAILTESGGASHSESLYIEVREFGEAVDPSEWFLLE